MAGTTTNFSISYPTSTDLVTNGATAIQTVAQGFDTRLGDVTNYPNQIVNVVSGVSRPVAYAMQQFSASVTGTATVTFPVTTRFTQTPFVYTNISNLNNSRTSSGGVATSVSSVNVGVYVGGTLSTTAATLYILGIQMTSAATVG